MTDRFDLEDSISKMLTTNDEIDDMMFRIADCDDHVSTDAILNMLIGIKELNQARYKRVWIQFEQLIKDGVIKNPPE